MTQNVCFNLSWRLIRKLTQILWQSVRKQVCMVCNFATKSPHLLWLYPGNLSPSDHLLLLGLKLNDLLLLALNTGQNTNTANLFSDHLTYVTEVYTASLRLSQRGGWDLRSSRIWRAVTGQLVPEVSRKRYGPIFKVLNVQEGPFWVINHIYFILQVYIQEYMVSWDRK